MEEITKQENKEERKQNTYLQKGGKETQRKKRRKNDKMTKTWGVRWKL